jgi:hypothetical protein
MDTREKFPPITLPHHILWQSASECQRSAGDFCCVFQLPATTFGNFLGMLLPGRSESSVGFRLGSMRSDSPFHLPTTANAG